ncbi:flagellar hook-associated protein FlgK [Muricoccus radiodurans]|uniref:flagellar hook-associated protein FlgK n=1 Tax=Muricoccus radiodurans TaxID=2231721 RepID=UPI003CE8BF81
MSLDLALSIARSGLTHVNRQLAQSAANVANAGTTGYTRKEVAGEAVAAGNILGGVRSLEARRDVDMALVTSMNAARATGAAADAKARLLQAVEVAHGRPEAGESVGDLTAVLGDAFVTLRDNPSEPQLQANAVNAADDLANRFNTVSRAIGTARQGAQDGMAAGVEALNAGLRRIAELTERIRPLVARGLSSASLEDQRDSAIASLSEELELNVVRQADGGVVLLSGGVALPVQKDGDSFSFAGGTVGASAYHGAGGSLPGVMLGGQDVTKLLGKGRLSAYAELRDDILPRQQAELDVAAANLASRFDAQGLRLFTGDTGTVPDPTASYATGGLIGFGGAIRVNPAVDSDPSLVRDGTHAVAGSAGGASAFTPNGAAGPAGFTTLLDRALNFALGSEVSTGNPQPGFVTTGLGPDGSLTSTLVSPRTLGDMTAQLVATQTAERSRAEATGTASKDLLATLETRFDDQSGVDMDEEMASMVSLQNAYAANARLMSAVQSMYDALLAAVR